VKAIGIRSQFVELRHRLLGGVTAVEGGGMQYSADPIQAAVRSATGNCAHSLSRRGSKTQSFCQDAPPWRFPQTSRHQL